MYYTQEQIDRANQADIVSFLQSQGEQLTYAGQEYRWKRHDSLTVRGNKWYRHSQSKGGGPVDFLMEFFGKSFTEAVELLTGEKGAAPPPDSPAPLSDFRLPPRSPTAKQVKRYLTEAQRTLPRKKERLERVMIDGQKQLAEIEERIAVGDNRRELIEQYTNLEHLTREIVEILVDYIVIGKRIPGAKDVPIEIHWNF